MKILIFNWRDITHPWSGGSEKYIHKIAGKWQGLGHTVKLVCGSYPGALPKEEIDGVAIRRLGSTHSIYLLLPFYYLFRLRHEKFDVIVENAYGITFFSVLFSRRPKVLIVHHDHTLPWQTEWPQLVSQIGIWIEQTLVPWLYKNVPVVTPSIKNKALLQSQGFRQVYAVLPGSEKAHLRVKSEKTKNPTILYLGRLRKYKRVYLLVEVFQRLLPKIENLRLIIAGTGQDISRIRHLISIKHLEGKVDLKGYVSESEKRDLLASSWVVAFPSQIEGWGLVALEAAAAGTPTVGFNVPGVSEAIQNGKSGFLVETKTEFGETLLKILTDTRLRKRLSTRARRWAATFSWDKAAKSFFSIMQETNVRSAESYDRGYYASFWRGASRRSFHPTYDIRTSYIANHLHPKTVLDVGCGTGLLVRLLRDQGIEASGIDISQAALDSANSRIQPYLTQGNILKLTSANHSYDTVSCVDVLEHIPISDIPQAIKECARVSKTSVYFDITCLEDLLFIHMDKTHITKLFSWQWKHIIETSLGRKWRVRRPFILPFVHHGIFVAERLK